MIADTIRKEELSLESRGVPSDSYFELEFEDGSVRTEHDTNWSEISDEMLVDYFSDKKTVRLCRLKVKKIKVIHGNLEKVLEIPDDYQVYQCIRSNITFTPGFENHPQTHGRVVGLVKDKMVVEEFFLNGVSNEVVGIR